VRSRSVAMPHGRIGKRRNESVAVGVRHEVAHNEWSR
jgi:hypothetical protein